MEKRPRNITFAQFLIGAALVALIPNAAGADATAARTAPIRVACIGSAAPKGLAAALEIRAPGRYEVRDFTVPETCAAPSTDPRLPEYRRTTQHIAAVAWKPDVLIADFGRNDRAQIQSEVLEDISASKFARLCEKTFEDFAESERPLRIWMRTHLAGEAVAERRLRETARRCGARDGGDLDARALASALAAPTGGTERLRPLPFGSITARGWMRELLRRSVDGMGGHYGSFDPDQFEKPYATREYDSDLLRNGKKRPDWCGEMSAEYRLGQLELGVAAENAALIADFRAWMEAAIKLQAEEPEGYFGAYPADADRLEDFNAWGAHIAYRALLLEYSRTGERRILDAVHRGLLWFVKNWAGEKKTDYAGPTILVPAIAVYRLTGDARLLKFCDEYAAFLNAHPSWCPIPRRGRIHCNATGDFSHFSCEYQAYHTVCYSTRAQLPGILYLGNGEVALLRDAIRAFDRHRTQVGWQITGAPVANMEHTSPPGCTHETEYCNFATWMEYLQWLTVLTGEARFGEAIERMTFNGAMGARKKDERAIAYNTAPNQFAATRASARFACQPYYGAYVPCEYAACCSAQSLRIIPAYLARAVLMTPSGDLAINAYGPYAVRAKGIRLESETAYPFDCAIRYRVTLPDGRGKLRLRRPAWARGVRVTRAGSPVACTEDAGWIVVPGPWAGEPTCVSFDATPRIRATREPDCREPLYAVEYGPLVFAQPLKERWTPVPADPTTRPLPAGWTWFDVTCAEEPPIYALPAAAALDPARIRVVRQGAAGYPWETPPLRLDVPMIRATRAYPPHPAALGKTYPPANPAPADPDATEEAVSLVPFGCTTLRLTCFPISNSTIPKGNTP